MTCRSNARLRRRDSAAITPSSTSMPASRSSTSPGRPRAEVRDRSLPPPPARPPRRSARGCRVGCDRSGCTARACRPRWPRVRGLPRRRAPSPRRAAVPGPSCQPSPTHRAVAIIDDDGAHHGIGRDAAPAAFGELERPPHLGPSCCPTASPRPVRPRRGGRRASGDATRGVRTAQPRRVTRSLPSRLSRSVPEFHRVHPPLAAAGSRTVTAGGELHPAPETGWSSAVSIGGVADEDHR